MLGFLRELFSSKCWRVIFFYLARYFVTRLMAFNMLLLSLKPYLSCNIIIADSLPPF